MCEQKMKSDFVENDKELIDKIMDKKEFRGLPRKDVELVYEKFNKPRNKDYQKLKLTRQFLRKIYSGFSSRKILGEKERDVEWYLMKHKSTKERYEFYEEVYERSFNGLGKSISVIDLGAGINGLSYSFFGKLKKDISYVGVEAVGQFVEVMNNFFGKNKIKGKAYHLSLFDKDKIKDLIKNQKSPRVVFLFKVIDSLEFVKRNYSKEILSEIVPLCERVVVSFATRSLGSRKKFGAQRSWLLKFLEENFKIIDDFKLGGERYVVFNK